MSSVLTVDIWLSAFKQAEMHTDQANSGSSPPFDPSRPTIDNRSVHVNTQLLSQTYLSRSSSIILK